MSVYEKVTASIVQAIETGAASGRGWKMPWHTCCSLPVNVATGRAYRGMNTINLWLASQSRGFSSPQWGTLRQWNQVGARVRKGERSSLVVFWKDLPRNDETEEKRFVLRTSWAFNAAQVDGFETPALEAPHDPVAAERLVRAAGVDVRFGGGRAFYHTRRDYVQMPPLSDFHTVEGFQSTLLHEAAHWTGHESRLAREFGQRFGDQAYAFEELVAELSAAFLCAQLGVTNEPREDHAEYVAHWLSALKKDTRAIFSAASHAQKATDFLMSFCEGKEKIKKVA
ncbi:MAG: ArdC family protein [Alkalilacustris sp.]